MLLYEDITEKIIRAFYEVHNELGSGLLEKVYERALIIELKNQGLKVENQKPLKVFYKGNEVGDYFSDLVVEDKIIIEADEADLDGLNFLAGKDLDYVNKMAAAGTILAHTDGGVPNLVINMPKADAFYLGYLFYFFEKACAISGYMMGINPFDQPGVEAYKKNMFALLEKPGFEKETEILKKRLGK